MTTPAPGGCTPDGSVPVTAVPVELGRDAAAQAAGHHVESTVVNVDQDRSLLGADDAASALNTQRSNTAMQPATSAQFTREDWGSNCYVRQHN